MQNTYVTVDALKGTGALNITGTAYDSRLLVILQAVSAQIDRYLGRIVFPYSGTKFFSGDASTLLLTPDLISVTSLDEDTNSDGTFETTWAGTGIGGTDFLLGPFNADPTSTFQASPYTQVIVNRNSNGGQDEFLHGQRNYRIVGTWGHQHVQVDVGNDVIGSLGSISSTITLGTAGTGYEVGQLLLIDTEWMITRTITTGTSLTVYRGVNGSEVGTHASGTAVYFIEHPGPVQEAVLIQTARLWKRGESAYSNLVGLDQSGQVAVFRGGLDSDVKALLQPYRRFSV